MTLEKNLRNHPVPTHLATGTVPAADLVCKAALSPVPGIAVIRCRFYDLERVVATPDFNAGYKRSVTAYGVERLG